MKSNNHAWPALGVLTVLQLAIAQAYAAPLALSNSPLFLTSSAKANVLMMYGNSNSMDSDPTGKAVGSAAPESKSEVARNAIKSVVNSYTGYINMGLMAYQQNALVTQYLNDSQYDVSYDPANYDPTFTGARNSQTKKFRVPNPTSPNNYIHFNVNLPYYSNGNDGNSFCYSATPCTDPTHDFKGTSQSSCATAEHPVNGPWDTFACYKTKTGPSNGPATAANGYSNLLMASATFHPTDSDLGQGITDFGKRLTSQPVSLAWFNNGAPGMGYLHVPVANLDAAQAAKIITKLGTSQFVNNKPTDPAYPLQNAGLSPLEGTVLTANRYFAGTLSQAAQGGPASAPPNSCTKNFLITLTDGLPSVTQAGVASADVAANLSGLTTQVAALKASASKTETYVVGFALPYGVSITQLDTIAAAGGSVHAYNANDTATLNAAFADIFTDIISKTSAASAVALNSPSVAVNAHVYQAKFSSGDWSGQLVDLPLSTTGTMGAALWDAGQVLNTIAPTSRVIITSKPSAGSGRNGIPFRWPANPATPSATQLDVAQTTALKSGGTDAVGSARLDYLRGAATNENPNGLKWRSRPTSKLGDIVNSAPHYVGAPNFNYGEAAYGAFRTAQMNRTKMIYVGANDGMLHGFTVAGGVEKLGYIPSAMYANLSKLTDPNYAHRYYVDGSPNSGDVYYGGAWHTVLVSGMGGGGRGVFGLDITDPNNFTEANAGNLVNFEFSDDDVGMVSGQIAIVKMNNGKWAGLFGNGYNSAGTGQSGLFIVDLENGNLIKKILTGEGSAGTPNALATPMAIDTDANNTVDTVYAGDMLGNMWKFDLSSGTPADWKVEYKLFQAAQPITAAPDVGEHPNGGFMVYFGTGKYLEAGDVSSTPGNAMYGIWDKGVAVVGTSTLVQQTLTGINDINGNSYRTASSNSINWQTQNGWYANFPTTAERVVSAPLLRGGRVIVTSIVPSGAECTPGGVSWLNEFDWLTGGLLAVPPLDTNGDRKVDGNDTLVQGRRINGIASAPAIQSTSNVNMEVTILNTSDNDNTCPTCSGPPGPKGLDTSAPQKMAKRLSWRQIK
jgi:type IV pilus assembly protein PilY1